MKGSVGEIVALLLLTPLILLSVIGVRDLRRYMQHAVVPSKDRPQVILLLGGIGWLELGILAGFIPDALSAGGVAIVPPWIEAWSKAVGAGLMIYALVLIRSGKAEHPMRAAAIYAIAMAACVAVGAIALFGGG